MKQEKIYYSEIMKLGFTEEIVKDGIYFNRHGFDYSIVEKQLTPKIAINWAKETQICEMYRVGKKSEGDIVARMKINNLQELKEVINFFTTK
jgi:phage anti-repressor protein